MLLRMTTTAIEHSAARGGLVITGISHLAATSGRLTLADPAQSNNARYSFQTIAAANPEVPDARDRVDRVAEDGLHHLRAELWPRRADGRPPHRPHPAATRRIRSRRDLRLARSRSAWTITRTASGPTGKARSPQAGRHGYEAIDWDTAIREIAASFAAIKARHGGESILYYGGGSQGNHLGGVYGDSTIKALGIQYRSNALAQEKTGEAWVQGKMTGSGIHGDFEHCEVAVFVGKNPWQSHGFARTRVILREIQNDPARALIVIDPRRSETAAMADMHLAVRPGDSMHGASLRSAPSSCSRASSRGRRSTSTRTATHRWQKPCSESPCRNTPASAESTRRYCDGPPSASLTLEASR